MRQLFSLIALSALLISCSGGGGGGGSGGEGGTFSISGTVSGGVSNGVRISLTGPTTASAVTDASGNYSFTGLINGTYSIIPSLAGGRVIFEPSVLTTTISGSGVANQNFVELVTFVVASGVQFLPASLSSANQYRVSLVPTADSLYFTDSSNEQLKRIDASSGAVTSVAARMGTPESVVIHGQNVFWVDGNRLNKTALDGTSTTILQTGARDAGAGVTADIVVDDTNAYWANTIGSLNCSPSCNWTIQRVPVTGGTPVALVNTTRKIAALTADANNIYWEEESLEPVTPGCECGSSIKMIPKAGGAAVLLVDNLLNGTLPAPPPGQTPASWLPTGGIAISGLQLFFGVAGNTSYHILRVTIANVALTTLASVSSTAGFATGSIKGLNVDSANVYWADGANGTIDTVPISGGTVVSLATGLSSVTDLIIVAGMAFWTQVGGAQGCCLQMGAGSIRQVPVAGGAATTVVGNLDAPGALAIDASNNVVWAEFWRVAKRAPAGNVTTLASGISSDLPRIAADQTNLYVLDGDLIKSVPLGGGRLAKLASAHGGSIGDISAVNQDITADGVNVYWSVSSVGQSSVVQMVPASGGAVVTLAVGGGPAPPQDCYWRMAVDSQNVYWSGPSSSFPVGCTVKKVPITGGAVTTLVDFAFMADFATDGVNVYFSELGSNPGSIRQTSVNGGPITMVTSNTTAEVLAVDAQNIYWLDPSDTPGGIWRIAKAGGPAGSATLLSLGPLATDPLLARESLGVSQGACFWSESLAQAILLLQLP